MSAQFTLAQIQPQAARGWTPALKVRFLDHLSSKGNARAACRAVGLSAEAAYRLRRRDHAFARGWAAALVLARENSVQVLAERAIEGVEEDIYFRGELVGTRRRYDSRLLLAHLARLDQLVDEESAASDAGRFDELLACIAEEPVPEEMETEDDLLPLDRDGFTARSAELAEDDWRHAHTPEATDDDERGDGDDHGEEEEELYWEEIETSQAAARAEAARAFKEASVQWDQWRARAYSAVDALTGSAGYPVTPGLPGNPLAPPPALAASPARVDGVAGGEVSLPRTASTVSTSALARALAGPVRGFVEPARSPFTAPRRLKC